MKPQYLNNATESFFFSVNGNRQVMGWKPNAELEQYVGEFAKKGEGFDPDRDLRREQDGNLVIYELADSEEFDAYVQARRGSYDDNALWNAHWNSLPARFVRAGALLDVTYVTDERGLSVSPQSMMDIAREMQKRLLSWSGQMCIQVGGATGCVVFDWDSSWADVKALIEQVQRNPDLAVQYDQL